MNVQGDGKDVWPWITKNDRTRFDVSKLDQWEIVFDYMDDLGLMLHIVTQETENELLLDIGELKTQRKLYYRELIARFAHHLAITWNLGEENGPVHWSPKGQNDADRKAMAKYIKTHDPYHNFVALHTHSVPKEQDLYLEPLLGFEFLDGPSMQTNSPDSIHNITKKWINESQLIGRKWIVSQDEIGPADAGAKPDGDDPEHNDIRHKVLWGNLMAGGAGVEWYFGYKFAHNDLNCEDWRSRENVWNQTKYALDFFNNYLSFDKMHAADGLTDNLDDYVFAENDKTYAIYLPKVKETKINLFGSKNKYTIKWYNPRTGGKLLNGSIKKITGGGKIAIGFPPNKEKDWVALITSIKKEKESTQENEQKIISLNAIQDFDLLENDGLSYYKDFPNNVLAINASEKNNRNKFAMAIAKFRGATGTYNFTFVTTAENDGGTDIVNDRSTGAQGSRGLNDEAIAGISSDGGQGDLDDEPESLAAFQVLGFVKQPGEENLPPSGKIDILQAIALAGGLQEDANQAECIVRRANTPPTQAMKVNLRDIRSGEKPMVFVYEGDIVMVKKLPF